MNRILWNERGVDIDEIVLHDVATVHVEQMDDRCWWIGITLADGRDWAGNFVADSRGRMRFVEQDGNVEWDRDDTHEVALKDLVKQGKLWVLPTDEAATRDATTSEGAK